jgi:perosamine synthetase
MTPRALPAGAADLRMAKAKTQNRSTLAVDGGAPVRSTFLPYGRQSITAPDIEAVTRVLQSDWLTTGPAVPVFEAALAKVVGTQHAVAVSSGTAALELLYQARGIGPGDEVLTTPLTFAATANAALYVGARPVFADVDPDTLQLDPKSVAERITRKTKAVVGVHFGGTVADPRPLREVAEKVGASVFEDAAHALGAAFDGRPAGSLADGAVFSFHPVKHVTTGEGGAVATDDEKVAARVRTLRTHGIDPEASRRQAHSFPMTELGRNYRLTDVQAALGTSQLSRLRPNLERRRAIAARYDRALGGLFKIPKVPKGCRPAYHLYPVLLDASWKQPRDQVFRALRAENIGVNVHYVPVYLHPYYRERFGTGPGLCPRAEDAYSRLLSLPMFHGMTDADVDDVVAACEKIAAHYRT